MRRAAAVVTAVAVALSLSACMEVEQTSAGSQKEVGKTVKRDTQAWDNTPLAYESAKWQKGDKASWENQIKARQLGQHEHKRIYQ